VCLSSQSSVPNRLRDKDEVGLVSLPGVESNLDELS
jgi:hypothetical protein